MKQARHQPTPSAIRRVLRRARSEIAAQRELIVERHCIPDKQGRPRLDTLELGRQAAADVRRMDGILKAIDEVLS